MDLDLNDKTVVITGGSKGIGLACARTFAAEGAKVVLAARSATDLNDAAATVHATTGATVSTLPVDLSDEAGQRALADAVGAVDVVVNNAGAVPPGSLSAVDKSEEHTSELQSLMRISYAVFCLKKKK